MTQTAQTQHTPTPWKYSIEKKQKEVWINAPGYTCPVAYIGSNHRLPQAELDAAFIVRACNSHKALLSIARNVLIYLNGDVEGDEHDFADNLKELTQKAIAKAEGNTQ